MDGRQTVTLRFPLNAASVIMVFSTYLANKARKL